MKSFVGKIESIPRSLPTKYGHFLRKSVSDLFQGQFLEHFVGNASTHATTIDNCQCDVTGAYRGKFSYETLILFKWMCS
jgi:hypothetical protein